MNRKVKILAVDDRAENLLALEGILASPEREVITKRSGEDALRYLLSEDISDLAVILMDVQMPGLNGFETVELIKQRERSREVPVIFLTAISTSLDHVLKGYYVGSIDYLFKPIDSELLKYKVEAFVKLHRYHNKINSQRKMLQKRALELEETNHKLAAAEAMLKNQNERLEWMVNERTRELLEANDKLQKSQQRFQKMFLSSPCLTSICKMSDFTYIDANDSWKKYTGYGDEAMKGSVHQLQFAPEPLEATLRWERPLRNVRVKYVTKSQETRNGLLSTEMIEIDDEICLLLVMIDITENVLYENEMTRLAELNLIGEMAAGIAHEIRNPMTTIRGFLQLSQAVEGRMDKQYLGIMLGELDRANGIITEFLSLAKNKKTDPAPRQLHRIVESLYPLIQAEAMMSGKHVFLRCDSCGDLLLDENEIRQLILNLSINGLEAMSPGGTLTIATYVENGEAVLKVADQGCGMSEEVLEKLGRPFFTTKEGGTGLGLAVCYSIVARHQAKLEVQSSDKGTTFTIRFGVADIGSEAVSQSVCL